MIIPLQMKKLSKSTLEAGSETRDMNEHSPSVNKTRLNRRLRAHRSRWARRRHMRTSVQQALEGIRANHLHTETSAANPAEDDNGSVDQQATINMQHDSLIQNSSQDVIIKSLPVQSECKVNSLRKWATDNQITHHALGDLLIHLRNWLPNDGFPKDPRTLLKTPRSVDTISVLNGEMFHFGLAVHIVRYLENLSKQSNEELHHMAHFGINISIGIDGLPVSKSSDVTFWPILGYINNCRSNVFIVSLFSGKTKPGCFNEFLGPFVTEMSLLETTGVEFENVKYEIRLAKIVADAPARAYIKQTKGHTGYYGCERCCRKGKYRNSRIVYDRFIKFDLYSDETFRRKQYANHHTDTSILEQLRIDMIFSIPLDYMHLCCQGVMKKLLLMWNELMPFKLKPSVLKKVSRRLRKLSVYIPDDFNRKIRDLNYLRQWKATEFRQFLLYVGPVVMKGILSDSKFEHFVLFHVSVYILCSTSASEWVKVAESYLCRFVDEFSINYSKDGCIFNVHMLTHLAGDALIHGKLDEFSAFPFENYMSKLKRLIRCQNHFLAQIIHRVLEKENVLFEEHNSSASNRLTVKKQDKDNYYLTNDMRVCILDGISGNQLSCKIRYFKNIIPVEWYPFDSSKLGIFFVSDLSSDICKISSSALVKKCIVLPHKKRFFSIPLC